MSIIFTNLPFVVGMGSGRKQYILSSMKYSQENSVASDPQSLWIAIKKNKHYILISEKKSSIGDITFIRIWILLLVKKKQQKLKYQIKFIYKLITVVSPYWQICFQFRIYQKKRVSFNWLTLTT